MSDLEVASPTTTVEMSGNGDNQQQYQEDNANIGQQEQPVNTNNQPMSVQPTDLNEMKKEASIAQPEKTGDLIIGGADDDDEEAYVPKFHSDSPALQLEWKELTYKVKVPLQAPANFSLSQRIGFKLKNFFKKKEKDILHPMSGFVSPGSTLAIMGPSGAG